MNKYCRICFSNNYQLLDITNTELLETWDKIANIFVINKESATKLRLCAFCAKDLRRCRLFMLRCLQSHNILRELTLDKNKLADPSILSNLHVPHLLTVSEIKHFDLLLTEEEVIIKVEELDVKNEPENLTAIESPSEDFTERDIKSSDSEDDIPLKEVALQKSTIHKTKTSGRRVRKKCERVKIDAEVIKLTKEEQMQEIQARRQSDNYKNSPFKCETCYKGFVEPKAMELHMAKHDESQGPLPCDICHIRFINSKKLQYHVTNAHARKYKCRVCAFVTRTLSQAREHDNWHKGFKFICQLCGSQFTKSSSYLTHVRKFHARQHACGVCGERFLSDHGLRMHESKTHRYERKCSPSEPQKTCDICGMQIKAKLFQGHLRTHEKLERLKCPECSVTFKTHYILQSHIKRIHLGIKGKKQIVCEACGRVFDSAAALKYHQRTHTGEKPHSCLVCKKRFPKKWNLKMHIRTHTGDKPYVCDVCQKRFSEKSTLTRHYRIHTGDKPFTCHLCPRSFTQSNSLKLHVTTVHLKMPSKYKKNKTENDNAIMEAKATSANEEFKINDD